MGGRRTGCGAADDRGEGSVGELVVLDPEGAWLRATGTLEGAIAAAPRGNEGFGYDPIFVPAGETGTVAELGNAWKSEHSHRAQAARAMELLLAGPSTTAALAPAQSAAVQLAAATAVERVLATDAVHSVRLLRASLESNRPPPDFRCQPPAPPPGPPPFGRISLPRAPVCPATL